MANPLLSISAVNSDEGDGVLDFMPSRLVQFKFWDRDKKVDKAELTLKNRNKDLLDNPYFKAGQELLISWGLFDGISAPKSMIVKKSSESGTNFVVTLKDKSVLMDKQPRNQIWKNVRDSDVVREIFELNGYQSIFVDIVNTPVYRESITQKTSDARMVTKLARRNGFVFWVDGSGAHFRPRSTMSKPAKWFTWLGVNDIDGEILAPGPTIETNFSKDIARVKVTAIDPLTHREVSSEHGIASTSEFDASLGKEEEIGDPDNLKGQRQPRATRTDSVNIGFATQEEVEVEAEKRYREVAGGRYKMKLPIKGDPTVSAKMLINLRNYSDAFSGLYYVYEALTTITPGNYKMDLSCRRDASGKMLLKNTSRVKKNKNPNDTDEGKKLKWIRYATNGIDGNNNWTRVWAYGDPKDPKTVQKVEDMTDAEKRANRGTLPGLP
jgi:hypothetical protein